MRSNFRKYILIQAAVISLLLINSIIVNITANAPSEHNGNNFRLETDSLGLIVTGGTNVPKYEFYATVDDQILYKVQFSRIFEILDQNKNGLYERGIDRSVPRTVNSLASNTWEFSEVETDIESELHFNLSTVGKSKIQSEEYLLQLNNHIYASDPLELKFDVMIENYIFTNENASLVLEFKVITENNDIVQDGSRIDWDNAYFSSEETADSDGELKNVGLSANSNENGTTIFLNYEHFDKNIFHDPTIGVFKPKVVQETNNVFYPPTTNTDDDREAISREDTKTRNDESSFLKRRGIIKHFVSFEKT